MVVGSVGGYFVVEWVVKERNGGISLKNSPLLLILGQEAEVEVGWG